MGLLLKNFALEKSDASALNLYDKTGLYDYPVQQTGWNNVATAFLADATAASATIYLTDTTTLLPSTTSVTINLFPTLPNVIDDPYTVTAIALGYTNGVIPDGQITIEYNVTVTIAGIPTTFTSSVNMVLYANACCCVQELISRVDSCNCGCNSTVDDALYASMLLKGIQRAVACGKQNKALEILKTLSEICANNNCKNCK